MEQKIRDTISCAFNIVDNNIKLDKILKVMKKEEFNESKQEVLEAAVGFVVNILSLWNTRVVEYGEPDKKISKEELYEELKKNSYEI